MLKGISKYLSPSLLFNLACMGHGDEIVLADAHFPGHSLNKNVIRADGVNIGQLIEGILPLFELDGYSEYPLVMMAPVDGDLLDHTVEINYLKSIKKTNNNISEIVRIERFKFYERAKSAFVIVMTGETAKYGNIILKKGVTPINN